MSVTESSSVYVLSPVGDTSVTLMFVSGSEARPVPFGLENRTVPVPTVLVQLYVLRPEPLSEIAAFCATIKFTSLSEPAPTVGAVWSTTKVFKLAVPVAPLLATSVIIALKVSVSPSTNPATPSTSTAVNESVFVPATTSGAVIVYALPTLNGPPPLFSISCIVPPTSERSVLSTGTTTFTPVFVLFHQPTTTGAPTVTTAPTANGNGAVVSITIALVAARFEVGTRVESFPAMSSTTPLAIEVTVRLGLFCPAPTV